MSWDEGKWFEERFRRLENKLDRILRVQGEQMKEIEDLQAEVTRGTAVDESAKTLIEGLVAQFEANKADAAAIQAIVDQVRANNDSLAAAVSANTPAAPTA